MSQLIYIQPHSTSKFNSDPLTRDWNDFQHLATQGRHLISKSSSRIQAPPYKLASMKKQLYHPRLPTIRRMERDDVLCRLPEEHSRHTTLLLEEQFQNIDLAREQSFVEFSGLNWHDTGKALMGSMDSLPTQRESSPIFGSRLRSDKSQVESHLGQSKLYRSPSLSALSPSASLTKPIKYSYHNFGNGTFDQSVKQTMWPRFHMNTRNSFDSINRMPMPIQMEGIFRSTSMHAGVSSAPWKPAGAINNHQNKPGSKTTQI